MEGWLLVWLLTLPALAQPLTRVANTTLRMPLSLAPASSSGFTTVDMFPGMSFNNVLCLATPPGETNRLFLCEESGRVVVITNLAKPTRTVFLDVSNVAADNNEPAEGGLLSLAFHPGYRTNGYFYLVYQLNLSTSQGSGIHNRLARFQTSPTNPHQAVRNSEAPLITQRDEGTGHNFGDVKFGPDGYLYVALGDEAGQHDRLDNSQRIDKDFYSGILRLDVDKKASNLAPNSHPASHAGAYKVPADNPFVNVTSFNGQTVDRTKVRTEFWAVGMRNPWRMSFDPATGHLYSGDVGQYSWEEVNIIRKGGNYGWAYREGKHSGSKSAPSNFSSIDPILEYAHGSGSSQGNCVIGGVVYRGTRFPELNGRYIFADHIAGNIWTLRYDGSQAREWQRIAGDGGIAHFGYDSRNGDVIMADVLEHKVKKLAYAGGGSAVPIPSTLSAAGVFSNLATLTPHAGIVPYELNVPFWSDHAIKSRWFSVPTLSQKITFNANGNWTFPTGAVWIKHFELELTNGIPASRKRLETRLLVQTSAGVYGVTYRWGNSMSDATLVAEDGLNESFTIYGAGAPRNQVWHYPSRGECLTCHTVVGGQALGFNTWQLNRPMSYAGGTAHQLQALSNAGYFSNPISSTAGLLALAHATNTAASLEFRTRSYLAANCVQCHQPGGTGGGFWDARITTPLGAQGLINGALADNGGDSNARVIKPGSLSQSHLLARLGSAPPRRMPPLATSVFDTNNMQLVSDWILSLPNTRLLPLVHLAFDEGNGVLTTNSGFVGGLLTLTTLTPLWSANTPAGAGAGRTLDFGTTPGNYGVDSSAPLTALAGLNEFTIAGWVNNRSDTEGPGGNRVVTWMNNGGDGVDLVYRSDGSLQIGIDQWPDSSPARSTAGKIPSDPSAGLANWRFFAVSYEASQARVNFYFGSPVTPAALDVARSYPGRGSVGASIGRLTVGHFNSSTRAGAVDRMFRGLIDQVRIYDSALALSEIQGVQTALTTNTAPTPPPSQFTIATSVSPAGAGTTSGAGTYNNGASVTISATPHAGYGFVRWTENGNAVSSSANYSFAATASRTLVGEFETVPITGPTAIVKLPFDETAGNVTANTGSAGGEIMLTTPLPGRSGNIPSAGGLRSLDFGAAAGNFAAESIAPIGALAGLDAFTICGWLNCRSTVEGAGGNRIVSWINNGGDGVDLVYRGDGSLQIGIDQWPDSSPARSSPGRIPADTAAGSGNWRFFAVTYAAATAEVKFYFGSNLADAALDLPRSYPGRGPVGAAIGRLAVGHFNLATRPFALDRIFRGLIDEVHVFGSALTHEQIIAVQRSGGGSPPPPPTSPEPLVHLPLEESSGVSAANIGSLGGVLALTIPIPAPSSNVPIAGGAQAMDFGAVPGNFGIDSAAPLSGLGGLSAFTICGWVNCRSATEGPGGNRIVSWINNGGDGVDLVCRSDGSLQIGIDQWPDTSPARSSPGRVPTDTAANGANWRFFAVTYDAISGQVRFYFGSNAADAALDVIRSYPGRGPVGPAVGRLTIGHFNLATRPFGLDRMFRGLIDDIRIFGQALPESEIISVQRATAAAQADTGGAPVAAQPDRETPGLPPRIALIERLPSGAVRLRGTAPPGRICTIWVSTNLLDWQEVASPRLEAEGAFEFIEPAAAQTPVRFYRIINP